MRRAHLYLVKPDGSEECVGCEVRDEWRGILALAGVAAYTLASLGLVAVALGWL